MLSPHGVDGALIGGASLHADQFLAIVQAGIGEAQVHRQISMTAIAPLAACAAWLSTPTDILIHRCGNHRIMSMKTVKKPAA